jgi:ribulose 1,5-bisphosphate synthetase/thiazole synthase
MKTHATIKAPKNEPVWTANVNMPEYSRLSANVHADVCIVGAGIAGLSCGYGLTRAGKSVTASTFAALMAS